VIYSKYSLEWNERPRPTPKKMRSKHASVNSPLANIDCLTLNLLPLSRNFRKQRMKILNITLHKIFIKHSEVSSLWSSVDLTASKLLVKGLGVHRQVRDVDLQTIIKANGAHRQKMQLFTHNTWPIRKMTKNVNNQVQSR
jgi:hypothetical protein